MKEKRYFEKNGVIYGIGYNYTGRAPKCLLYIFDDFDFAEQWLAGEYEDIIYDRQRLNPIDNEYTADRRLCSYSKAMDCIKDTYCINYSAADFRRAASDR